jgi:FtsP/CotA-like multicopper oxidase with cupredoxin domain
MVATVLLGLAVGVLSLFAVLMWADAHQGREKTDSAAKAAAAHDSHSTAGMPGMNMPGMNVSGASATAGDDPLASYAGAAPEDADALATAHKPFPADLPPAPAGVANVKLDLTDITIQVAPGVKYAAWAWAGGAPGPVIHVRQGQLVKITLTNKGAIHTRSTSTPPGSHNKAFGDVFPGKSVSYTFAPTTPASSCTTAAPSRC